MPMTNTEIMFSKRALHKYIIRINILYEICEKLFSKTQSMNLVLALQADSLNRVLEKSSS